MNRQLDRTNPAVRVFALLASAAVILLLSYANLGTIQADPQLSPAVVEDERLALRYWRRSLLFVSSFKTGTLPFTLNQDTTLDCIKGNQ